MKKFLSFLALTMTIAGMYGCAGKANYRTTPDDRVFIFYYNWYGNEEVNGKEIHWAHGIIGNKSYDGSMDPLPGKENLAANFYPELKNYSSTDPAVISAHMDMMAKARTGIMVVTWWRNIDFGSQALDILMNEADKRGLKVCFHLEPYSGRSAESIKEDIVSINARFGKHNAYYKMNGKPCFFIYDSYLIPASEWARVFTPEGDLSIRGTEDDAVAIGLWVKENEDDFFIQSGMDGFYTYFAADGFTYGSTSSHWAGMAEWAAAHGKIFIPCVGPGYIDTRVRPWNCSTTRDREHGRYYERMFRAAAASKAPYIGITSFNEWHEGTQIEPAIPFSCKEFTYMDYSPEKPDFYLEETARLIGEWQ